MIRRLSLGALALIVASAVPGAAFAEPMTFKMLSNQSRATFKTDAPSRPLSETRLAQASPAP
jgi:uncharacterized membrane protein YdfJ with MMPL/SSD domain